MRRPGRGRLLGAWLDLRTGHLGAAREALTGMARTPVLRRDALLAAAVTVGLARRSGDAAAIAATWARVAPVVAGADVELLLLDVWGELSVVAEQVSPTDRDLVVDAMRTALRPRGLALVGGGRDRWWQLERAVVADDPAAAADAAAGLATLAGRPPAAARPGRRGRRLGRGARRPRVPGDGGRRGGPPGRRRPARRGRGPVPGGRAAHQRPRRHPAAARRGPRPAPGTGGSGRAAGLLSEREREVGALVLDGLTQKEIGARLYISPKTVEQHVARMRQKLAASNRADARRGAAHAPVAGPPGARRGRSRLVQRVRVHDLDLGDRRPEVAPVVRDEAVGAGEDRGRQVECIGRTEAVRRGQ